MIFQITKSACTASGSEPGPTANLIGRFLVIVDFHSTYTTSGIYLTSMTANPLMAEFAKKIAHVDLTWGLWLAGSIVPGVLTLLTMPWIVMRMIKPEIVDTKPAREGC